MIEQEAERLAGAGHKVIQRLWQNAGFIACFGFIGVAALFLVFAPVTEQVDPSSQHAAARGTSIPASLRPFALRYAVAGVTGWERAEPGELVARNGLVQYGMNRFLGSRGDLVTVRGVVRSHNPADLLQTMETVSTVALGADAYAKQQTDIGQMLTAMVRELSLRAVVHRELNGVTFFLTRNEGPKAFSATLIAAPQVAAEQGPRPSQ